MATGLCQQTHTRHPKRSQWPVWWYARTWRDPEFGETARQSAFDRFCRGRRSAEERFGGALRTDPFCLPERAITRAARPAVVERRWEILWRDTEHEWTVRRRAQVLCSIGGRQR